MISVRVRSFSGPYSVRIREKTDLKNFKYGHFSGSVHEGGFVKPLTFDYELRYQWYILRIQIRAPKAAFKFRNLKIKNFHYSQFFKNQFEKNARISSTFNFLKFGQSARFKS